MAEPAEGTYVILSVGSSKAIDVVGANDKSGTNVRQYTKNNGEGEFWAFDKQSNGWQIICSLTGKALDIKGGNIAAGTNIQQWSDNNRASQRWNVATDGRSFSYGGTSYPSYTIKPKSNSNFALAVRGNSTANGANIELARASTSNFQRWILIPAPVLRENGTYEIVLAADPTMCVEIAQGSTANSANVMVYNRTGGINQIFRAAVDGQTFLTTFYNYKSKKVLDIHGGASTARAGKNVIQYTYNGASNQKWLPVKNGSVKINGKIVPTYTLRSQANSNLVLDCQGGGKTAKTNIEIWTYNGRVNQRFAFVKTEATDSSISVPGAIKRTLFTRNGPGSVTINGLSFASNKTMFQSRYKVEYYKKSGELNSVTNWMSTKDNSSAREGWGDAWTYTFKATPVNGVVSLPFSKAITLNNTDVAYANIIMEVRTFVDNQGGTGYKAHSNTKSTTIKVRQQPTIVLSAASLYVENNEIGVQTVLTDSLDWGCTRLRGRLKGSDGCPISSWVDSSVYTQHFPLGSKLYRLPNNNEQLTYEYSALLKDGLISEGTKTATFTLDNASDSLSPTVSFINDGSCSVEITSTKHKNDGCVMEINTVEGAKFIPCLLKSDTGTTKTWKALPPLNQSVKITVYGSDSTGALYYGVKTVKIKSHSFIWNWTEMSGKPYEEFSTILFATDEPPQQNRQYSSNLSYQSPTGRIFPVGFATRALTLDLSIEGVIVDPEARYQAAGPLPARGTVSHVQRLVTLAGKGIHPIYRTPYGDYYQVGIEQVNVSKTEMNLSKASVTQHALED